MKKIYLLLLAAIFSFNYSKSQWVSIPDTNFGTWLNTNGYSSCMQGNATTGWNLDTTCAAVNNEDSIDFHMQNMSDITGIQYFRNLKYLYAAYSQIRYIPIIPNTLEYMDVGSNFLDSLPELPQSLLYIDCAQNDIDNLPVLPSNLSYLSCAWNNLTYLPTLPDGLRYLHCGNNPINNLPALPDSLRDLICFDNQLTNLPALPNLLNQLECERNQLTTLPVLPDSLVSLAVMQNYLTVLPSLPYRLTHLSCSQNQLSNIPSLPSSLTHLSCRNNQLTNLPALPDSLIYLVCSSNQLTSLPDLPDTLWYCYVDSNPNLSCLPSFRGIRRLQFANTNITCKPQYEVVTLSSPSLDALPACNSLTPNPCPFVSSSLQPLHSGLQFHLSPNPATTATTITIDESLLNSTATLTDITGRRLMAVQLTTNQQSLITSNLSNGVYFITLITNEGKSATKKLVVSR